MAAGVSDKKTGFWKTNCRTPEAMLTAMQEAEEASREVMDVIDRMVVEKHC